MGKPRSRAILIVGLLFLVAVAGLIFVISTNRMNESHQAHCLFDQRAVFVATKAYMKDNGLKPGDPLDSEEILRIAAIEELDCWSGGEYTWREKLPNLDNGELPVSCSHKHHQPSDVKNW